MAQDLFDFNVGPTVEILNKAKIPCHDLHLDQPISKGYDWVQMKWDGWWAIAYCRPEGIAVYSCGGVQIDFYLWESDNKWPDTVLIGEYIGRTNWSQTRSELGKLAVHDILFSHGNDFRGASYANRYYEVQRILDFLGHSKMFLIQAAEITDQKWLNNLWQSAVVEDKFEGLVYKRSTAANGAAHGRTKGRVDFDYVIMGISEGGGRLHGKCGALLCGLYFDGVLKSCVSVGGGMSDRMRAEFWERKDELIGKVIEVRGALMFPGGSMRHPQFTRFREDKRPEDCVLK